MVLAELAHIIVCFYSFIKLVYLKTIKFRIFLLSSCKIVQNLSMIPINDDDKSDILSQDLFIYITHLEEAFNEIEESEEKTIIQVR